MERIRPVSYSFYTGKTNFSTRASDPEKRNNLLENFELDTLRSSDQSATEDDSSEVEESDIWKIVGNSLYFFLISKEVCKSLTSAIQLSLMSLQGTGYQHQESKCMSVMTESLFFFS